LGAGRGVLAVRDGGVGPALHVPALGPCSLSRDEHGKEFQGKGGDEKTDRIGRPFQKDIHRKSPFHLGGGYLLLCSKAPWTIAAAASCSSVMPRTLASCSNLGRLVTYTKCKMLVTSWASSVGFSVMVVSPGGGSLRATQTADGERGCFANIAVTGQHAKRK